MKLARKRAASTRSTAPHTGGEVTQGYTHVGFRADEATRAALDRLIEDAIVRQPGLARARAKSFVLREIIHAADGGREGSIDLRVEQHDLLNWQYARSRVRPLTTFEQAVEAEEVRADVWRDALDRHAGMIARAAEEFGFSRQRGYTLTWKYGLIAYARDLRIRSGQPPTGRPRTILPPKKRQ